MKEILEAINTELIRVTASLNSELRYPGANPDVMDYENRIKVLRRIKTKIEDSMI